MASVKRAALLSLLVMACGPRAAPGASPGAEPLGAPRVTQGSLDGSPLLGDLPARVRAAGGGPLSIVGQGPLSEGERVGAFVDVPMATCLLLYARGASSIEDIDLAAYSEDGNPVAVDEGRDPHPTLLVCPPHPDRVYVSAHSSTGEGLVVVAAQLVPRDASREVARVAGARGALGGTPRTPEAWPGLDFAVRTHRAALGGAWTEARRVAVTVDARLVSTLALHVEPGGCTAALVVPDDDVAIVDLEAIDDKGSLVARAREGNGARAVVVCSRESFSGALEIRPHVGRGIVAVVLSRGRMDGAGDGSGRVDVAWHGTRLDLEAAKRSRSALLGKAGYGSPTSSRAGKLLLGARSIVNVDAPRGAACSRIDVVAGAPLALVEARASDDAGALLGEGEGADGAVLYACGRKARLDLAAVGRPGPYAVMVRNEPWTDAAFAAHPLAASRMLSRALAGPTPWGVSGAVHAVSLDAGHVTSHAATVPPSRCVRVYLGVEGDGTGIELRAYDVVSGEEIDRSNAQTSGEVRACATSTARSVRFEARATTGKLSGVLGERWSGR